MGKWMNDRRKAVSILLVFALILTGNLFSEWIVTAQESESAVVSADVSESDRKVSYSRQLSNPRVENGVTTWDCVYFGYYWQNDTDGDGIPDGYDERQPVKWRVLSVDGDDAFLLADQSLDCQQYHEIDEEVTWETCTLRNWLNDNFLNRAFNESEQMAIRETTVVNEDDPVFGVEGGNDTHDRIYLPSRSEMQNAAYGFPADNRQARQSKCTWYTRNIYAYAVDQDGLGDWWLRSPAGVTRRSAYADDRNGTLNSATSVIASKPIRPVLHLDLSASGVWTPAGTVSSDGKTEELPTPEPTAVPTPKPLENPRVSNGITIWDCVWFGNYWQRDTNGDRAADEEDAKESIRWRVLSVDGDDAFLMADQDLDYQIYNYSRDNVTWASCELRNWLNNEFLDSAFDESEKKAIKKTLVVNKVGASTQDNVYLLSLDEVTDPSYGFDSSTGETETRKSRHTEYVLHLKGHEQIEQIRLYDGNWYLRSLNDKSDRPLCVDGSLGNVVLDDGYGGFNHYQSIRPVLHLNLSLPQVWSPAGTVSSDGKLISLPAPNTATQIPSAKPAATTKPTPERIPKTPSPYARGLGNPRVSDGVTTWDCVWFGNYWQNDTNGDGTADQNDEKEPVKWRVLFIDGDDAFLLADQNIDRKYYNEPKRAVTWETCTLRTWLNHVFFQRVFSFAEQNAVLVTDVRNADNPVYGTNGGNDTKDRVYLMSIDEVMNPEYGFESGENESLSRESKNTEYAKEDGNSGGVWQWWLRSPGYNPYLAATVDDRSGGIEFFGCSLMFVNKTVRPVLHLDLSANWAWALAGTVSSDDTVDEIPYARPEETPPPYQTPEASETPGVIIEIIPWESESPDATPKASELPNIDPSESELPEQTPEGSSMPDESPEQSETPASEMPKIPGGQVQPVQTAFVELPTASPVQTEADVQWKITGFRIRANARQEAVLTWKKTAGVSFYNIYRATSRKGSYRLIKTISSRKTTFVDQPPRVWKKYYYKVSAAGNVNGVFYEGRPSGVKVFQGRELRTPTLSVKKGMIGTIRYVTVSLRKYQGNYVDIYISTRQGKYRKLKLVSNEIKKYKGKFKIQYIVRKTTIRFKVRTYKWKKKKKIFSGFSREYKIQA